MAEDSSGDHRHPYPHIEVTRETFPRFLATRTLDDEDVEYFGAFLTKTSLRILIDFLNRVFRLRSCDVDIDGSFSVPCTQYFRRRCLAPCVGELCSPQEHIEAAEALRLFLKNDRQALIGYVNGMISKYSDSLEFERAAFYRDMLGEVEKFWKNPRWNVWLDDAVDTYHADFDSDEPNIYLVTTRGRHALGKCAFTIDAAGPEDISEIFANLIERLYGYYLPREIRVSRDFSGRRNLAKKLSEKFRRDVKITVVHDNLAIQTAMRAMKRSKADVEVESVRKRSGGVRDLGRLIQAGFGLEQRPERIEAVDVAHISGTGMVGAASVWAEGRFVRKDYGFAILDSPDEVSAIGSFVAKRYGNETGTADLTLVDGGRSQLNSAVKAASSINGSPTFISAVKPRGKHSQISHFLTASGLRVEFDPGNAAHLLLQRLRDDAHELANFVHGEYRDARHFYEVTGKQPLIVPIRFTAADGSADDLRPIVTKNRPTAKPRTRSTSRGLYRPSKRAR